MSSEIARLFTASPAANTEINTIVVYTPPSNKMAIMKSITVCNATAVDQRFSILISGYPIVYNHLIKPFDTIVLPTAGLIVNPAESVRVGCTTGIAFCATGVIFDASERNDKPYILTRANALTTLPTGFQVRDTANNLLIKSVTFCNVTNADATIALVVGPAQILANHILKAYDTLTLPFLDQLLVKGEYLQAWTSAANTVVYHAVAAKVVTP